MRRKMSDDIETYTKLCKSLNSEPLEYITKAFTLAGKKGELDLSGKPGTKSGWDILGKIIISSKNVQILTLRDCFIPPRGFSVLLNSLCQNSIVHTLDLRGNNIQSSTTALLGKLLRHNITLKKLSLEWNSLGTSPESFGLFCDAIAISETLEYLDIKNNQISIDCTPYLAEAITKNKSVTVLDLRWNSLAFKGGQLILSALQHNQTMHQIKVQGNSMPDELMKSIEQVGRHNKSQENLKNDTKKKTDFLVEHLKKSEENKEILLKESQEKMVEFAKESETLISQLEAKVSERDSRIKSLESDLECANMELKCSEQNVGATESRLAETEAVWKDKISLKEIEVADWEKKLLAKNEEVRSLKLQHEAEMSAEQSLRAVAENKLKLQLSEVQLLEQEVQQHSERMRSTRHQHEDTLLTEFGRNQDHLLELERRYNAELNTLKKEISEVRKALDLQEYTLTSQCQALEAKNSDLVATMALKDATLGESIAQGVQEASTRIRAELRKEYELRLAQLDEKVSHGHDEKSLLEKQMNLLQSTMTQLQQHNATLVAEIGEPQRKANKLQEDLAVERLAIVRLNQELNEERMKVQLKAQEIESTERKVQVLNSTITNLNNDILKEKQCYSDKVKAIRQDEAERAGALYSAFNKYLSTLNPAEPSTR